MATTAEDAISQTRAWLLAFRPHTIPASASPVVVGTALAFHDGVFATGPAVAALLGAILLQIGTNLANDYFDYEKGVDTEDAPGYVRATQSGLIPARRVLGGAVACFGLAFLIGIYLVAVGGLPIVVVGLASIASGFAYSGGPYPIGYHGLGDLFTFVFFGLVAVTGTYYVQAASYAAELFPMWVPPGTITLDVLVGSLSMAGLITGILVVNNIRDLEDDERAGKHTLAVLLGYRWSRLEYVALVSLSYLVPFWFLARSGYGVEILLPLLTLPIAVSATRTLLRETSTEALNPVLERTGQLTATYAALFAVGVVI